jgi:chromosomal replication initiator protein
MEAACTFYDIDRRLLFAKTRKREVVIPRHVFRWFAVRYQSYKTTYIADSTNGDHTTVLNSIRAISDWVETDPDFERNLNRFVKFAREFAGKNLDAKLPLHLFGVRKDLTKPRKYNPVKSLIR